MRLTPVASIRLQRRRVKLTGQAEDPEDQDRDAVHKWGNDVPHDIEAEHRKHEEKHHEDQERIATDLAEASSKRRREQALNHMTPVERRYRQQVEDAKEQVNQDEIQRIRGDEACRSVLRPAG